MVVVDKFREHCPFCNSFIWGNIEKGVVTCPYCKMTFQVKDYWINKIKGNEVKKDGSM